MFPGPALTGAENGQYWAPGWRAKPGGAAGTKSHSEVGGGKHSAEEPRGLAWLTLPIKPGLRCLECAAATPLPAQE